MAHSCHYPGRVADSPGIPLNRRPPAFGGVLSTRTVTDNHGRKWRCRPRRTASENADEIVLECQTAPTKGAVLVPVGSDWENLTNEELARRISEGLGPED